MQIEILLSRFRCVNNFHPTINFVDMAKAMSDDVVGNGLPKVVLLAGAKDKFMSIFV